MFTRRTSLCLLIIAVFRGTITMSTGEWEEGKRETDPIGKKWVPYRRRDNLRRRVGPPRANPLGLRAHVDHTEARNNS